MPNGCSSSRATSLSEVKPMQTRKQSMPTSGGESRKAATHIGSRICRRASTVRVRMG